MKIHNLRDLRIAQRELEGHIDAQEKVLEYEYTLFRQGFTRGQLLQLAGRLSGLVAPLIPELWKAKKGKGRQWPLWISTALQTAAATFDIFTRKK